ncbi:MAG TPA: adenylate/guanylate cyclase domain-containing protein [Saprospiraceae bacterium]|nr:adenylate/guanylate cyclase domain-containing protein [Saprospiraceae bacterium]
MIDKAYDIFYRFIIFSIILFSSCSIQANKPFQPKAENGVMDLREWNPSSGPVTLHGEWHFYWQKTPEELNGINPILINVPGAWNKIAGENGVLGAKGYGVYRLRILFPENSPALAIEAGSLNSAGQILIAGENDVIFNFGMPGRKQSDTKPGDFVQVISFQPSEETTIDIYVSNYNHRLGGIMGAPKIGKELTLRSEFERRILMGVIIFGSFLILSVYYFLFYFLRREQSNLYFAIFCLIMALRTLFVGDSIGYTLFPKVSYEFELRLEYLCLYLGVPLFLLMVRSIFPEDFPKGIVNTYIVLSSLFGLAVLFLPTYIFTQTLQTYQVLTLVAIIICITIAIIAVIRSRIGSMVFLIGFIGFGFGITSDIIIHNVYNVATSYGMFSFLFFVMAQAMVLSWRFAYAFNSVERLTEEQQRINESIRRFVPVEFLHYLKRKSITDVVLGDQIEREMTVMFTDIRDFTRLSEEVSPQETFDFLNNTLKYIAPSIRQYNGFIDKYIGDAIMALFPHGADNALQAGIRLDQRWSAYNRLRSRNLLPAIGRGTGLHTGKLILGTIGEPERMETTVISDAVNVASRLEGLCKTLGATIIFSEATLKALNDPDRYSYRLLDRVQLRGKSSIIDIYEAFDGKILPLYEMKKKNSKNFSEAINAYYAGEIKDARVILESILSRFPGDIPVQRFLEKVLKQTDNK